uniref:Uncharacterized protein n=1 Tax=Siphoviridae sp. ctJjf17 TaxID=2827839 RepID=A0A8S5SA86_9CAUD|nr:MAG TPA: hypothetical protein [Siphoviridae sp. ctJjf17]
MQKLKIITSIHIKTLYFNFIFLILQVIIKKLFTTRHTFNIFLIFLYEEKAL